jgi:hypothetical protein
LNQTHNPKVEGSNPSPATNCQGRLALRQIWGHSLLLSPLTCPWNGRDPILKTVRECYYYLDSTPMHSYMKFLYKYPQAEFPYAELVNENRRR